jgi:hypothetical protein
MKRFLVSASVVVGLVALASASMAGDFHSGVTLICSDCHVMHASQQHGYNANGSGSWATLGAAGPYEFLLRNDINDLCLSCHDNQAWAPDVFESHGNGYVRQGGALNEVGGNGLYPPATGHTLNSTAVAPGGTWSNAAGLHCTDCHGAHGNSNYRNLGGFGTVAGGGFVGQLSYQPGGTNDVTKWVYEDAAAGTNASHYGVGAITFNEPDATKSKYGEFCKSCHTNFHGDVPGTEVGGVLVGTNYEEFHRHPASTVNIGAVGGGHSSLTRFAGKTNQVQVMSPTGVRAGSYTTQTDLTVSCMSCHKGHGNQNAFGLIFMLGTGTVTEQGDSGQDARNLCRQCHGMGGSATTY